MEEISAVGLRHVGLLVARWLVGFRLLVAFGCFFFLGGSVGRVGFGWVGLGLGWLVGFGLLWVGFGWLVVIGSIWLVACANDSQTLKISRKGNAKSAELPSLSGHC